MSQSVEYANLVPGTKYVMDNPNLPGGAIVMTAKAILPKFKNTTLNATTGSLPVGAITGAEKVYLTSSNATPGAQLVRTAAQLIADMGNVPPGFLWQFRITNTGAGVFTLTADAGATITLAGTMTIAQNTWRDFNASIDTAGTATITAAGTGTNS